MKIDCKAKIQPQLNPLRLTLLDFKYEIRRERDLVTLCASVVCRNTCCNITVRIRDFIMSGSRRRRRCRNDPDVFCYICDEYVKKVSILNVGDFTKRAY